MTYIGRELSGGIYIIHPAVILVFDLAQIETNGFKYIEPVLVFAASAVIVFCVNMIMNAVKNTQNRRAAVKTA